MLLDYGIIHEAFICAVKFNANLVECANFNAHFGVILEGAPDRHIKQIWCAWLHGSSALPQPPLSLYSGAIVRATEWRAALVERVHGRLHVWPLSITPSVGAEEPLGSQMSHTGCSHVKKIIKKKAFRATFCLGRNR